MDNSEVMNIEEPVVAVETEAASETPCENENILELPAESTVEADPVSESEVQVEEKQLRVNPPIPPGGRANMGRRRRRRRKDT